MNKSFIILFAAGLLAVCQLSGKTFVPPNHPSIQYFGRWDMSDSLHPRFSWPGTYLQAEFTGTSIGIRLNDPTSYYNVFIDGVSFGVFHGSYRGEADYVLAEHLPPGRHSLRFSRRNISFDEIFVLGGLFVDDGAGLLPPLPRPKLKIEFIGDSFTAAESNEAIEDQLPWEQRFPVTNIDKGFGPLIAGHFSAEYQMICRSGSGLVCDWRGDANETIPRRYLRTLMDSPAPEWDCNRWQPDLIVICLGFNDFSGLKDSTGSIPDSRAAWYRRGYHEFLSALRRLHPGAPIVAVAPFPEPIRNNVKQVVAEEQAAETKQIFYCTFEYIENGYVANGHPTVSTHKKMADQLIRAIESFHCLPAH